MASGAQNRERNDDHRHPLLAVIVGSILGGGGTIGVFLGTPAGKSFARPDPFTGTEGAQLKQRVVHIEQDVSDHLNNHPDVENQFDRRIATLEAQYAIILQNQGRILDRLDSMN